MGMDPDQCDHLRAIYKSNVGRVHCVKGRVELCGWGGQRPELLSCYTCFAGDKGVQHGDFEVSKLNSCAGRHEARAGFPPAHRACGAETARKESSVQCPVSSVQVDMKSRASVQVDMKSTPVSSVQTKNELRESSATWYDTAWQQITSSE